MKWIILSQTSCKILNYLIRNAIDYTEFETNSLKLHYEKVDLDTVLTEVEEIGKP